MSWWRRVRDDLAQPDAPVGVEERPFLLASAVVIALAAGLTQPGGVAEVAALVVAAAALALRGVWRSASSEPFALVVGAGTAVAVGVDGNLEVSLFLGVMMTLYAAWHVGPTSRAGALAVASAAVPLALSVAVVDDMVWTPWVTAHLFVFVLGRNLRRQRLLIAELRSAREALADRAVAEERRRIARELHDLAGHTLAAMLLHVTGARHVLRRDLDDAERALCEAEDVGRASLDQIRVVVGQLRTWERGTDPALSASADLDALVGEYRRAGLHIDAELDERVRHVEGPVAVAVHRICQEALANVARHAPANEVRVALHVDGSPAELRLVVADRGRPPASPSPGGHFGIVGMRERALALGGRFEAGPAADGWRVEAALPLGRPGGAGSRA